MRETETESHGRTCRRIHAHRLLLPPQDSQAKRRHCDKQRETGHRDEEPEDDGDMCSELHVQLRVDALHQSVRVDQVICQVAQARQEVDGEAQGDACSTEGQQCRCEVHQRGEVDEFLRWRHGGRDG